MFNRARNRRVERERGQSRAWSPRVKLLWQNLAPWLGVVAGLSTLALALVWVANQPIRTLSIAGRFERVSPMDVQRAVRDSLHERGLLSVDLNAVGAAVRTLPWVDVAQVRRSFPRGLVVTVTEQAAVARWSGGGLLNLRGEGFASDANHVPPELPLLSGPEGSQGLMVQRYLAARGRLQEIGLRLNALRLDARGAWELELDNGVAVRLGRKDPDGRFDTFLATAAKIVTQRAGEIAYVDMRYTNGFAIGWRGGAGGGAGSGTGATQGGATVEVRHV